MSKEFDNLDDKEFKVLLSNLNGALKGLKINLNPNFKAINKAIVSLNTFLNNYSKKGKKVKN